MENDRPTPALEPSPDASPAPAPSQPLSKHGRRLSPAQLVQVLAMHTDGVSGLEISRRIGCHHDTVYSAIDAYTSTADLAAKFLAGHSLSAAKQWTRAVRKGAARGRHEPARDLLLHTGAIQPVNTDSTGGAKVAVFIGIQGQNTDTLLVQAQPVGEAEAEAQALVVVEPSDR